MKLYIDNGLIVDPANHLMAEGDLMIEDGIIREVVLADESRAKRQKADREPSDGQNVIRLDAKGKWVVPGLIDLHVHLREPGYEYKETIETGARAAVKGGFTTICCMPNTNPVIDSAETVRLIDEKATKAAYANVLSIGAITKGQEGMELADYRDMIMADTVSKKLTDKGICGISEDGMTVEDEGLMLEAMKKAKELGLTVFSHAEPEVEIVERDIRLAEKTGCRLHFCHISEEKSLDLIRKAKKQGICVTAETAPHYFTLDSSRVQGNPDKKMNPPLRMESDMKAVRDALKDGTLDVIATDHAPHHASDKSLPFDQAANGVAGLETSFAVSYTKLVKTGILTPLELIYKMSAVPARLLGIRRGSLQAGYPADISVIDVNEEYEIRLEDLVSMGKNSPFLGMHVSGKVKVTITEGKIVWEDKND